MENSLLWLDAVAQELKLLADDIAALGERLSGEAGNGPCAALQYFDPLSQRAAAQADLLLALRTRGADPAMLIARVPFHDARLRLLAAVTGEARPPAAPDGVAGMELF